MRYPRWCPQTLTQGLLCACLAALLAILAPLAYLSITQGPAVARNLRTASDALPQAMASVKEAADTANLVSTESLNLVGSTTKLVDGLGRTNAAAGELLVNLSNTSNSATGAVESLKSASDSAAARIDALAGQQARADAVLEQLATIPTAVTAALKPLPDLETSITRTSTAAGDFMAGPASALAGNAATTTKHVDDRFFAPYSGKHPRCHAIWQFTQGALGLGARGAQGAYYGVEIAK